MAIRVLQALAAALLPYYLIFPLRSLVPPEAMVAGRRSVECCEKTTPDTDLRSQVFVSMAEAGFWGPSHRHTLNSCVPVDETVPDTDVSSQVLV